MNNFQRDDEFDFDLKRNLIQNYLLQHQAESGLGSCFALLTPAENVKAHCAEVQVLKMSNHTVLKYKWNEAHHIHSFIHLNKVPMGLIWYTCVQFHRAF